MYDNSIRKLVKKKEVHIVKKLVNIDSPLWGFMGKVCDIILLSTLWVLFSVPLITMGAATSALYHVILKLQRDEGSGIFTMFWNAFRDNLKQTVLFTLLIAAVAVFLYADFMFSYVVTGTFGVFLRILLVAVAIVCAMTVCYLFPLQVQFQNTVKNTLKNAVILAITYLPLSAVLLVVNLVPVIVFFTSQSGFMRTVPVWLFLAPAGIAYICTTFLRKLFDQLIEQAHKETL